jgi:hypothetical protein
MVKNSYPFLSGTESSPLFRNTNILLYTSDQHYYRPSWTVSKLIMDAFNRSSTTSRSGYDMLTSVEDLIGRMVVASERKASQSAEPDLALLALGFPYPSEATNDQLSFLQSFYTKLLRNIEDNNDIGSESESILTRLDKSEDDAMFLLYVLEFPLLVLTARTDTTGIAKCYVDESYEIFDIANRIIRNKTLLIWCRNVIANQQQCNCTSIIASAVSFLAAIDPRQGILSLLKVRKVIRKQIFDGKGDAEGFSTLRKDLAGVVSRDGITHTLVANSILLQFHIIFNIYGESHVLTQMQRATNKESFTTALIRVKDKLDENLFRQLLIMVDSAFAIQYQNDIVHHQVAANDNLPYHNRDSTKSVFICGHEGCTDTATKKCNRCKLVGYCSRECQVASWKVHKKNCKTKPKMINTKKVEAATDVARQAPNPVLVQQEYLLRQNPNCNYVIVMPSGKKDTGVQIDHPMGKLMFGYFRMIAPTTPGAVFRIYDWLVQTHPKLESIIRNQLMAEYGIDPLSDTAKNSKIPEMNEEDVRQMCLNA